MGSTTFFSIILALFSITNTIPLLAAQRLNSPCQNAAYTPCPQSNSLSGIVPSSDTRSSNSGSSSGSGSSTSSSSSSGPVSNLDCAAFPDPVLVQQCNELRIAGSELLSGAIKLRVRDGLARRQEDEDEEEEEDGGAVFCCAPGTVCFDGVGSGEPYCLNSVAGTVSFPNGSTVSVNSLDSNDAASASASTSASGSASLSTSTAGSGSESGSGSGSGSASETTSAGGTPNAAVAGAKNVGVSAIGSGLIVVWAGICLRLWL